MLQINRRLILFVSLFVLAFAPCSWAQNRIRTFDAQHYIIRTSFDRPTKTVFGETTVRLKPLASGFKEFVLDAINLQVDSVTLEGSDKTLQFFTKADKLNITLDKSYSSIDTIAVNIKYKAIAPKTGLFFVDEERDGDKVKRPAQIWSQGEPEDNRHWFPSYDFPDDKATTEQFITVSADETAIGNGELVEVKEADSKKTYHYRVDVPHTTYLVSLVVGKYAKVEDNYNGILLNFFVYPGTETIVPKAYGKTKKMFAFYESKLGVKYPYKKYDQTVVGAFTFGGMENITATTMADTEIYRAAQTTDVDRNTENLVSHELAHSWFGNLVTTKNWSNLWLNEGFATFFESAFIESEYGRAEYLIEMRKNAMLYMFEEFLNKHPLLNLRAQPDDSLFDATTYKKGAVVLHMLRETVGDDVFWKTLNVYLNRHKFGVVETSDLQKAFEETSGQKLNWFFDQWVRKAGYPKLKITPTYNPRSKKLTLTVRQTQVPDSQTPEFFRFRTDVEIITPWSAKTEKVEIIGREQTFTFDVGEKPIEISFDKSERVLKKMEMAELKLATAAKNTAE